MSNATPGWPSPPPLPRPAPAAPEPAPPARAIKLPAAIRRERLLLRSAALRAQIAQHAAPLKPPLALADQVGDGLRWLRQHPEWPLGGLLAVAVLRPRRALRWSARLWSTWRLWRKAQRFLALVPMRR